MSCTPEPEQNLERALAHIRDAAGRGAEIICLPELFQTQYFCQREDIALFDLAEPIPGPATKRLGEVARELSVTLIVSLFERRAPGLYHNTVAILDTGGKLAGIYRKMHIPDDPLYYEKFYFTPGDLGFKSFATDFGRFGTLVCWDQWYPEGARLTALQGASVLFYPTAIGWHPDEKAQYGESQYSRRGSAGQGPGILGRFVHRRSVRTSDRRGLARQARNFDCRSRSSPHGRRAAQLAVLARPARRCLRRNHAAVPDIAS
jgi:N-carbamoylputrescine amidase